MKKYINGNVETKEKRNNTRSKYIAQQHEYLMFDGQKKETQCRYKLCSLVSSENHNWKKTTEVKIDSDLSKYCECCRGQRNFNWTIATAAVSTGNSSGKKQMVCSACILWVIYQLKYSEYIFYYWEMFKIDLRSDEFTNMENMIFQKVR